MRSSVAAQRDGAGGTPWLVSAGFDVTMLVASVVIVPVVLAAMWMGASSDAINLGVTAIVGGPHLFATFTATYANRAFRARHPWLVATSFAIPLFVMWMTVHHFQVLMSVFIVAASLHVIHQCAYVTDCYRAKAAKKERSWARFVDYGVLFSSIYPIAIYKIVGHTFVLGDVAIIIPEVLMRSETVYLEWAIFAAFLGAYLYKTALEAAERTLNGPKTVLIAVTVVFAFLVPGAAGKNQLDMAFQSLNAWHSFQYLGLCWLINTLRNERGLLSNKFVAKLSGRAGAKYFYLWNMGVTVVLFLAVKGIIDWDPIGISHQQYYYMLVLSPLLIHYYFDTFVFLTSVRDLVPSDDAEPFAAAAA